MAVGGGVVVMMMMAVVLAHGDDFLVVVVVFLLFWFGAETHGCDEGRWSRVESCKWFAEVLSFDVDGY